MKNPAVTDHDVHPLIRERWSPCAMDPRPIPEAALRSVFEAARWAPSRSNGQPWRFIVARREDETEFARLLGCLVERNQQWVQNAGALMISVARLDFERNGKPNRHAFYDVGLAAAQLTLQATALGLMVHHMAGYDVDLFRATYDVPEGFDPVAAIAIGYAGDIQALPEDFHAEEAAPRQRKRQDEFVFSGAWGRPLTGQRG